MITDYRKQQNMPTSVEKFTLPQETIDSIVELGEVLKVIRKRMLADGYTIVSGQIKKLL